MLELSDQVKAVLKAEGYTPHYLEYMLRHGAITSLRGASRRYHHWLFRLQGQKVVKMFAHYTEMDSAVAWEDCTSCEGRGCKACGWSGQIPCN